MLLPLPPPPPLLLLLLPRPLMLPAVGAFRFVSFK